MSRLMFALGLLATTFIPAMAEEPKKDDKVEFTVHSGHFESNKSGLKGDSSFLLIKDQAGFDAIFGTVPPLGGKKHNWLPGGAFDNSIVVAVIKRGGSVANYSDVAVTKKGDTITVTYKATQPAVGGTARFASPLIVSIPKASGKKVVFIENGKEAGKAE